MYSCNQITTLSQRVLLSYYVIESAVLCGDVQVIQVPMLIVL